MKQRIENTLETGGIILAILLFLWVIAQLQDQYIK
jgi:hypothetical protein